MSLKEKIKPLFFALSLIIGGFVFAGNAYADIVVSEDFESYSLGEVNAYNLWGPNTGYIYGIISNTQFHSSSKSIYTQIVYDRADYTSHFYSGDVSFYFYPISYSNPSVNTSFFTIADQTGPPDYGTNYSATNLWGIDNNGYLFLKSFDEVNVYNGNVDIRNSWHKLSLSLSAGTLSFYLDNILILSYSYSHPYNWVRVSANPSFSVYIDDININASSTPPNIDGSCGIADNNLPTTIPIPNGEACSAGTVNNMHESYSFDGIIYSWSCIGSGEGITVSCETLPYPNPINGACGSANNTTVYNQPEESEKCSAGATNSTTLITLTGWSWVCEGLYGGTDASCSATYAGGGTPPTIPDTAPIPTPTDCEAYSGIDKIFCNFGNTIEGLFLPSTEKLTELQTTINSVGNVFPFNYLRVIGNTFSNMTITQGSLTLTMWGNTETINPAFWDLEIFDKIRLFSTILILLMFTFWAVGYIKHFFK